MSLETWKEEFYPKDAKDAAASETEAAKHSLLKWQGLHEDKLAQHACYLRRVGPTVMAVTDGQAELNVDYLSCALCARHPNACNQCTLFKVREAVTCDEERDDEHLSPFKSLGKHGPSRMILWLERAVALAEGEAK